MRPTRLALLVCLAGLMLLDSACFALAANSDSVEPVVEDNAYELDGAKLLSRLRLGSGFVSGVTEASWLELLGSGHGNQGNSQEYQWQLMPEGLIYRPYLAGAKESRFRSIWNNDRSEGNIWDISLGGQVGVLRFGTSGDGRPQGWQLGIEGAGLVRLDRDENNDVMASDYRFGIPLTWGDDLVQYKFAYYHLSSHLGDEFLLKNVGYPRLNFSRDVLVMGVSLSPLKLWRVYSEIGYAFRSDVAEQWEFQFGIEYSPDGATGMRGQPFAAVNGHLREEVEFGGNFVAQTGWAWRRSAASGMFRMGVEYYNGKNDQFSFFDLSEEKVGFGMWYDY